MSQMHDMPPESEFGHEFNYAVWSPGSLVYLGNVPWDSTYRDIVKFSSDTAMANWFKDKSGPVINITGMTYIKPGRPVRLDVPFNKGWKYNYLMAYNPAQPIGGGDGSRRYYYFIQDVVYVAPNTTEFVLQLDVWQTFGFDVEFGSAYIDQGHIGIANENQMVDNGRAYLTTPEGLDMGSEYQIHKNYNYSLGSARGTNVGYRIMVVSTVALDTEFGTVRDPKLNTARGTLMENLPGGAEIYLFDSVGVFSAYLATMSGFPWVTQGIISITAIPKNFTIKTKDVTTKFEAIKNPITFKQIIQESIEPIETHLVEKGKSWRDDVAARIPSRYRHLKKFQTSPYTVLELTAYNGQPLVIKPESWPGDRGTVMVHGHFAPPGGRVTMYPFRYNTGDGSDAATYLLGDNKTLLNDGGEFFDFATSIANFPQFSLVNNSYQGYLASNSNSLAFQKDSADWSQNKALRGNETSFDQATSGIATANEMTAAGVDASMASNALDNETAGYQGIQSAANSFIGGPIGGAIGTANAAVTYGITTNQNNKSTAIGNTLANRQNRAQTGNMANTRDTNKAYGDFAAKGDYQNQIAGIQSKVQDAKMLQPSTSGQVGGDAFNLAQYKWGYDVKVKTISPSAIKSIGEYWLRYGYAVGLFIQKMPKSLQVMDKFTYWKLRETYLIASQCPEPYRQTIRGIFEKGVTVWGKPEDIGRVDSGSNKPLKGIKL